MRESDFRAFLFWSERAFKAIAAGGRQAPNFYHNLPVLPFLPKHAQPKFTSKKSYFPAINGKKFLKKISKNFKKCIDKIQVMCYNKYRKRDRESQTKEREKTKMKDRSFITINRQAETVKNRLAESIHTLRTKEWYTDEAIEAGVMLAAIIREIRIDRKEAEQWYDVAGANRVAA